MLTVEDNALVIYTDGSSFQHPRRGGYGIRIIYPPILKKENDNEELDSPSFLSATNNEMELLAVIEALKHIRNLEKIHLVSRIIICTDSMYVANNYNNAKYVWPRSKWLLTSGAPVQNADLWIDLVKISSKIKCRVEIRWVKGHAKDENNKAVDHIAKKSAKCNIKKNFKTRTIRRKISDKKVNVGSIKSTGQRLTIRVIYDEYLKVQKLYKYKIEVLSKRSKYYGNIDFAYSKILLKAGHSYIVSTLENDKLFSISKIIQEVSNTTCDETSKYYTM